MKTRLAALFLVLLLAGSAFAGIPMKFGDGECSMHGMDCCMAALSQEITPEVADAKLCCALVCAQTSPAAPGKAAPLTSVSFTPAAKHPVLSRPSAYQSLLFHPIDRLHGPPASGPLYLRNLAFLI
jgi:hypothetical protein